MLKNNKKAFDGNDIENEKSTEDKEEINLPTPSKFPKFVDDVAVQNFFQRIADDFSSQLDGYSVQYSDNDESTVSKNWKNSTNHSSEIRGLCSTKCSSETLQNLLYFMYKENPRSFFRFLFRATLLFPL